MCDYKEREEKLMLPKATKRREKLPKTLFYLDLNEVFLQKAAYDI